MSEQRKHRRLAMALVATASAAVLPLTGVTGTAPTDAATSKAMPADIDWP